MKIISPSFEILTPLDGQAVLKHIELCGRVCYKSEDKITGTSAATFVDLAGYAACAGEIATKEDSNV